MVRWFGSKGSGDSKVGKNVGGGENGGGDNSSVSKSESSHVGNGGGENSSNSTGADCIDVVRVPSIVYSFREWLSDDEFGDAVGDAWDSIPVELAGKLDNVSVLIEDVPEDRYVSALPANSLLLGLYVGVPLTKRSSYGFINAPDIIHIYKHPIFMVSHGKGDARERVRRTVLHEVGHYFGLGDNRLRELGY